MRRSCRDAGDRASSHRIMRIVHLACLTVPLLGFALAVVPACKHDDGTSGNPNAPTGPSAGPAQKTGEKVDEGAAKVEEKSKDAANATGSAVEKTGEKMKPKD